jgi:KDO2-lipid IV(A) lauroyltransferase
MRFLIALLWLLHWLPLPILGRIGKAVGSLMYSRSRNAARSP